MSGGSTTKAEKSTGSLPWWIRAPHQSLIEKAETFTYGDRGAYTPYPNQRIAQLTAPEQAAVQARQDLFNRGDPSTEFASSQYGLASLLPGQMINTAYSEFTPDELQRRMSPYMQGVIDPQLRVAEESFNRRLNESDARSVARGGSVGDYRQGLERVMLEGEKSQALGDIQRAGMQASYEDALRSFEGDRASRLGGLSSAYGAYSGLAQGASALGDAAQRRELANIVELERSGMTQRELQQQELDLAYRDFIEERDFPMQRMQFLSSMLSSLPTEQYGGQTTYAPSPGLPSQLAALGLAGASVYNQFRE